MCLLCCCLCSVWADPSSLLYSATIQSGNSITIDETSYEVSIDSGGEKLRLLSNQEVWIVFIGGTCTQIGVIDVCATNYQKVDSIAQADIDVYTFSPELEITKTLSPDSGLISEIFTIELLVENIGDAKVTDVVFEDGFSSDVELLNVYSPCKRRNNSVYWEGDLGSGDRIDCRYRFKGITPIEYSSKAYAQYEYKGNKYTALSALTSVEVTGIVEVDASLTNGTPYEHNETELELTLTSNDNQEIEVEVDLFVPVDLEVDSFALDYIGEDVNNKQYLWDRDIEGVDKSTTITLVGEKSGYYPLTYVLSYEYDDQIYTNTPETLILQVTKPVLNATVVEGGNLTGWINITPDSPQPGELLFYRYHFQNNGIDVNASALQATLRIDDEVYDWMSVPLLTSGQGRSSTLQNFSTPYNWSDSLIAELFIEGDFNGSYYNFTNTTTFSIASSDEITIESNFSVENVTPGQIASRLITLRNPKKAKVSNIVVEEKFPPGVVLLGGATSAVVNMVAGQNITPYSYRFYVSDAYNGSAFETVVNYTFGNATFGILDSEELEFFPKTGDLKVNQTIANDTTFVGELVDIDVRFENNGSQVISELSIEIPLSRDFGSQSQSFYFDVVRPGEVITFEYTAHSIAYNQTATLSGVEYTYLQDDVHYIQSSNDQNFTVNITKLAGPAIDANAYVLYYEQSDVYQVTLDVVNNGSQVFLAEYLDQSMRVNPKTAQKIIVNVTENVTQQSIQYLYATSYFDVVPQYEYGVVQKTVVPEPLVDPDDEMSGVDIEQQGAQQVAQQDAGQEQQQVEQATVNATSSMTGALVVALRDALFKSMLYISIIAIIGLVCIALLVVGIIYAIKKYKSKPSTKIDDAYLTDYDKRSVLDRLEGIDRPDQNNEHKESESLDIQKSDTPPTKEQ